MYDLRKEITRMSREISTLKSTLASPEVDGAEVASFEERLRAMDVKILKLSNTNERSQDVKSVNNKLEGQNVVLNGVNLTTAEEIHRI